MEQQTTQTARLMGEHRRRRRWQRVMGVLAALVVFCTTYALILPAITMTGATICGIEEHTHTEACYTVREAQPRLVCTAAQAVHVHTDACLGSDGEWICGQADFLLHTHEESCYGADGSLICPLEEIEAHSHTAACWELRQILVCPLEEDPGHTHGESCYTYHRGALICTQAEAAGYSHTADCYTTVEETVSHEETVLSCGLEESETHAHGDACYTIRTTEETVQRQVLTCTLEETDGHTHGDACYAWDAELICTQEERPAGHLHGDACYTTDEVLACPLEEIEAHVHTPDCCGDILDGDGAVVSSFEDAYAEAQAAWTGEGEYVFDAGEWAEYLVCGLPAVEEHQHTDACFVFPAEGETETVLTCGREEHVHTSACYPDGPAYICGLEEHTHEEACYDAEGTLICALEEHIHGESCLAEKPKSEYEAAYGSLAELPDGAVVIPAEEPGAGEPAEAGEYLFRYEDAAIEMTVQLTGEAPAAGTGADPETDEALSDGEPVAGETEPASGGDAGRLVLAVIPQEEDSQAYCDAAEYAAAHADEAEELCRILTYEFRFFRDGAELDVSGCQVTVELSPKETAVAAPVSQEEPVQAEVPAAMRARRTAAAPAESGEEQTAAEQTAAEQPAEETVVRISVLQEMDGGVTETDSALVTAEEAAGTVVRFTLQSSRLAVALSQTANPHFNVQYYAYIPRVRWKNENAGALSIIDTDNGGQGKGGNLPQNGQKLSVKYLAMEDRLVAADHVLTEVYQQQVCEYIKAPNLTYFNSLYENGNYQLKEIWVLQKGADPSSTDQGGWTVYQPTIHFTNRQESANETTVRITDDTVLRLVYDITKGSYRNDVNFYDYDITNGKIFGTAENAQNQTNALSGISAGGTYYVKTDNSTGTDQQGINSSGNYSGSGTRLAFGNNNTRVGLGTVKWGKNEPNKFNTVNKDTGGGCTFGLASGMDGDGNIQFARGIQAPALFGTGSAAGKTAHLGYGMNFQRQGDTYTLTNVTDRSGNAVTQDLTNFMVSDNWSHTAKIYANNFWPLDSAYNYQDVYAQGHDPKTGPAESGTGTHIYAVGSGGTEHYPASDNGVPHNNYFGMNFAVQFELVEDYVGPLEYLFFGDDDMWVFLDGRLVCDIGGVHSSVGEYVNLWDYIEKGTAGTHTLSFFYTERGASGSSCYMQFTLPSVSSATPEQNTGELRVEKKVEGALADSGQEFAFDISFTDPNGFPLPDDYSYSKYDAQGNYLLSDVIIYDGGSFTLEDGQYIIVKYLPYGTKYTITEAESPQSCRTTVQVNGGVTVESRTAAGTIPDSGERQNVLYTNFMQYVLPETGGDGRAGYIWGGLGLMAGSLLLYMIIQRRGKGGTDPA